MIDPALAESAIRQLTSQAASPPLTDHEQELLAHVLGGLTNSEIADRMGTDVGAAGAEVAALIGRVRSSGPGPGHPPVPDSPGRHRRG
jgi:DNA-binding NarL/FixJ family response regulator